MSVAWARTGGSALAASPDLAGFRDALERKRAAMSEDVVFRGEPEVTLPPGTPTDPETGLAYDPVIVGSAVSASASIPCEVIYRIRGDHPLAGAIGWGDDTGVVLITDADNAPAASGMIEFYVHNSWFEIRAQKFDGVVGVDRYLIWGAEK